MHQYEQNEDRVREREKEEEYKAKFTQPKIFIFAIYADGHNISDIWLHSIVRSWKFRQKKRRAKERGEKKVGEYL